MTIIEPGPFRTDFLGRSGVIAEKRIADYDSTAGKMRKYFAENDGKQPGDPLRAVHAMMQVVDSPKPPLRLLLGRERIAAIAHETWRLGERDCRMGAGDGWARIFRRASEVSVRIRS